MSDYTPFDTSVNSPVSPAAGRHACEAGAVPVAAPVGLSLCHNSPQEELKPFVQYAVGGSYVKVGCVSRPKVIKGQGGKRGRVCGRSNKSRKRLLDRLHQINRQAFDDALFLTLTYSDECDFSKHAVHIDRFNKRLARHFPKASAIISKEYKPRLSGELVGRIVPHFHAVIFGVGFLAYETLARWWFEIVASGDPKHLAAGTKIERPRTYAGSISYVSKYMSKDELSDWALRVLAAAVDAGFSAEVIAKWWALFVSQGDGRTWYVIGRENLPVSFAYALLSMRDYFNVKRQLKNFVVAAARRRGRRVRYRSDPGCGVSAYVSDETTLKLVMMGGD